MATWRVGVRPFLGTVHFLGIVAAIFVLLWSVGFRGGLAWNSPNKDHIFNIHPVLMVIGFIFLSSEAILVYKTINVSKRSQKIIHLSLQGVAFIVGIIGISAAFKYHNEKGIDNLYSLHSWLGLLTIILFGIQWIIGFITFWYPGGENSVRSAVLPWHVFLGLFTYGLAIATAEAGALEKLTFLQTSNVLGHYSSEAIFVNCLGLILILLGGTVILAAVLPKPTNREDEYRSLE